MNNVSASPSPFAPQSGSDPEVEVYAEMLRGAIDGAIDRITPEKREPVRARLSELLAKPKVPQRGGPLLNNVYEFFKRDPQAKCGAGEVIVELAKAGIQAEAKPVHNALQYLRSARILRRVGYGQYQLDDGRIVDGPV